MDFYTDVHGQCCGRNQGSMPRSGGSRQPSFTDMPNNPWAAWQGGMRPQPENSCSYPSSVSMKPAAPVPPAQPVPMPEYPSGAAGSSFLQPGVSCCPSTDIGYLEQQYALAMAYVPWQQWKSTYGPERALIQGTVFPELDKPFIFGGCSR